MITAEEARKLVEKESEERKKARQKIYETYVDKIEILIKATCKLVDLSDPIPISKCCRVKFVDDKTNLSPDELIYDKVVFSRILNELKNNGFTVYNHIKPSFKFNEFGSNLATGYIEISW